MTCPVFERGSFWTKSPPWTGASPFQREMERIRIPPPQKIVRVTTSFPSPLEKQNKSPALTWEIWVTEGERKGEKREAEREREIGRGGREIRDGCASLRRARVYLAAQHHRARVYSRSLFLQSLITSQQNLQLLQEWWPCTPTHTIAPWNAVPVNHGLNNFVILILPLIWKCTIFWFLYHINEIEYSFLAFSTCKVLNFGFSSWFAMWV